MNDQSLRNEFADELAPLFERIAGQAVSKAGGDAGAAQEARQAARELAMKVASEVLSHPSHKARYAPVIAARAVKRLGAMAWAVVRVRAQKHI